MKQWCKEDIGSTKCLEETTSRQPDIKYVIPLFKVAIWGGIWGFMHLTEHLDLQDETNQASKRDIDYGKDTY